MIFLFTAVFSFSAIASTNQVLVLSGGNAPFGNHYSQYLQTKLLTDQLRTRLGESQVDVLFGAGNSQNSSSLFPDVHKDLLLSNGETQDHLFPGVIRNNKMAVKENVFEWFGHHQTRNDNLFLFVTDHGMPYEVPEGEEEMYDRICINLWAMNTQDLSLSDFKDLCLTVQELDQELQNTNANKKIFAMTQCYSGGFHEMSVKQDREGYWSANPNVCGFSAITEDETASGCTSNVDGPNYKGYERYLAEALTGVDVVSGKKIGNPAKTLRDAHYAASKIDDTKDIPLSTSEYYLRRWSWAISDDKKTFQPRTKVMTANGAISLFNLVNEDGISRSDILKNSGQFKSWFEFQFAYLDGVIALLSKNNPCIDEIEPKAYSTLSEASRRTIQSYYSAQYQNYLNTYENGKLSKDYIEVPYIDSKMQELAQSGFPTDPKKRLELLMLFSDGYKNNLIRLTANNSALAPDFAKMGSSSYEDQKRIAKMYNDGTFLKQIEDIEQMDIRDGQFGLMLEELKTEVEHIRRIRIMKSIISAAYTLIQMKDQKALNEFKGLLDCESTAF